MRKSISFPLFLLAAALLVIAPLSAQEPPDRSPGHDSSLTIGLTPDEQALVHLIGLNHRITAPPTGPVRAAAEWDESIGVFCLWDNAELMRELQKDNDLYIITTSYDKSWWESWLASNGIPTTNVEWLIAGTNSWWVRDYGPWFLWDGNNDFGLVDNIYNRPRPLDDKIPQVVSSAYGIPLYATPLEHTGGNYYADGYGNAWSSTLVYSENAGMTQAQVDGVMAQYLGIDRYVTRDLKIDIEHFDTFGKLLAPDVLLWSDFPLDKNHRVWSEAALKYYRTLESPYCRPYRIHRMPLWNQSYSMTAYINSLMTANKIIIPRYNNGYDDTAAAIFQDACPGYEVAKVWNDGTYWGDSVHCRTRNFHRGDGVRIYAFPPGDTEENVFPTMVRTEIYTDNGTALLGNPKIFYSSTGGAPFSSVDMQPTGNANEFEGGIPAQPWGTTVSFYVFAEDLGGSTRTHPPVAPQGLHSYLVERDIEAPGLDHDLVNGVAVADWPPLFTARAVDNTGIPAVTLEYMINGVPQTPVPMTRVAGTFLYEGTPAAPASLGNVVSYRIVAVDTAAAGNTTAIPARGWNHFKVTAHNAVCIIDLDKTPFSGDDWVDVCSGFALSWDYTASWPSSLAGYDAVLICLGMNPHNTQLTTTQANELVSFLSAGGAAYMEGGNCFAEDSARSIYRPYFGVSSASSGSTLAGTLSGVTGMPTAGMSFGYDADPGSSDNLTAATGADAVIKSGSYNKTVTYDTGTYSTVGSSFEFCGLVDGPSPSRAKKLAAAYLDHLGLDIDLVVHGEAVTGGSVTFDLEGAAGDSYTAAYAFAPGYKAYGAAGVVLIDMASLKVLATGTFPSGGSVSSSLNIPPNPFLIGRDVFFQALIQPAVGTDYLTNRDRIRIE